nr:ribonuclease H2 subunit B [Tanacetum cinerariifolium]
MILGEYLADEPWLKLLCNNLRLSMDEAVQAPDTDIQVSAAPSIHSSFNPVQQFITKKVACVTLFIDNNVHPNKLFSKNVAHDKNNIAYGALDQLAKARRLAKGPRFKVGDFCWEVMGKVVGGGRLWWNGAGVERKWGRKLAEFAFLALQLAFSSVFLALLTETALDFSRLRHASRF